MPSCVIDGKTVDFKPGENLVETAKRAGIDIPVFCYHPGLSVVGQCRMCAVEIEKMPKLQTACSTAATEGMIVHTQTEKPKKHRAAVMEFLLLNHPLDCPICDKSGECDLQDSSYNHGNAYMRHSEERRTYADLDMGGVIKKSMNRCIHCTRCIRFGDEVAGIREMVAIQRGNNTEITTLSGRPLETGYAGNYSDICPTGSLTLKDFRFNKRSWFLKKTPSICEGCSRGCNLEIHQDGNVIHRCLPRTNMEVNKYWLCDEGRFWFHYVHSPDRIVEPAAQNQGALQLSTLEGATQAAGEILRGVKAENMQVLVGTDLTQEEAKAVLDFVAKNLKGAAVAHFGTPGISKASDDSDEDKILKRKSKTANLHGIEKLAIAPWSSTMAASSAKVALVFRGGRAKLPDLSIPAVGVGVFQKQEVEKYRAIYPGHAFAEKNGTVVNSQGMEQKFQRAIMPPQKSLTIHDALKALGQAVGGQK